MEEAMKSVSEMLTSEEVEDRIAEICRNGGSGEKSIHYRISRLQPGDVIPEEDLRGNCRLQAAYTAMQRLWEIEALAASGLEDDAAMRGHA